MQLFELIQQHLYYINDLTMPLWDAQIIPHLAHWNIGVAHVQMSKSFHIIPCNLHYQIFDESNIYNVKHKTLLMLRHATFKRSSVK